ncbi:hypothetical protein VitviT2T_008551 [Vitis vinifera]|uniref:WHEP-TRS domain-containing protein n=1 Tax=Vitis vinifera TaxID=29760 RepID=A0ABY9C264_VITVI|nr:hypothetical protein VitviT2T_008551 [Vitis vinifera]
MVVRISHKWSSVVRISHNVHILVHFRTEILGFLTDLPERLKLLKKSVETNLKQGKLQGSATKERRNLQKEVLAALFITSEKPEELLARTAKPRPVRKSGVAGNLVIVDAALVPLGQLVQISTCVHVESSLKVPPEGTKQRVEFRVEKVHHVGPVDPAKYPLPKTRLTLKFLRVFVHFRSRTNMIPAVARICNALAYATHTFFQNHGFLHAHTPIITTSDCEGAGEMFRVTTLISDAEKVKKELIKNPSPSEVDIEADKALVKEKGEAVAQPKSVKASKGEITAFVAELNKAKENLSRLEERSKLKPGIPQKDGKIDYSQDFFVRQAFLTVSGQLQVETYACAIGSVYTFGPIFRAEHSHTSRHLVEFWMMEPEIAFADLKDDMNCAEAYVKFLC